MAERTALRRAASGRRRVSGDRPPALRLLADIGGTNVRFAVQSPGEAARKLRRYRCVDFPDIVTAVSAYFRDARIREPLPTVAAIAIAAPIVGDRIHMTNHPWDFSIEAVRRTLGFEDLIAVNDFLAIARVSRSSRRASAASLAADKPRPEHPLSSSVRAQVSELAPWCPTRTGYGTRSPPKAAMQPWLPTTIARRR